MRHLDEALIAIISGAPSLRRYLWMSTNYGEKLQYAHLNNIYIYEARPNSKLNTA